MKKYVLLLTLFLSSTLFAEQLHNYYQIKSAVIDGKKIRVLINYSQCTSPDSSNIKALVSNQSAVYTPNAIALTNDERIAFYILYFTMKDGRYPARPVYQYGTFSISTDNILLLTFSSLNAVDYSPLGESVAINCKLDEGAKVFLV